MLGDERTNYVAAMYLRRLSGLCSRTGVCVACFQFRVAPPRLIRSRLLLDLPLHGQGVQRKPVDLSGQSSVPAESGQVLTLQLMADRSSCSCGSQRLHLTAVPLASFAPAGNMQSVRTAVAPHLARALA